MSRDPSRRPSNERIRVAGNANAVVWIECPVCLGDGWHYPQRGLMLDRLPPTRKLTCVACSGLGAQQIPRIQLGPDARTVPAPKGFNSTDETGGGGGRSK